MKISPKYWTNFFIYLSFTQEKITSIKLGNYELTQNFNKELNEKIICGIKFIKDGYITNLLTLIIDVRCFLDDSYEKIIKIKTQEEFDDVKKKFEWKQKLDEEKNDLQKRLEPKIKNVLNIIIAD